MLKRPYATHLSLPEKSRHIILIPIQCSCDKYMTPPAILLQLSFQLIFLVGERIMYSVFISSEICFFRSKCIPSSATKYCMVKCLARKSTKCKVSDLSKIDRENLKNFFFNFLKNCSYKIFYFIIFSIYNEFFLICYVRKSQYW